MLATAAVRAGFVGHRHACSPVHNRIPGTDNVLQGGRVLEQRPDHPSVAAIQRLNDLVVADPRVESVMLPVRDGVTLIRKR